MLSHTTQPNSSQRKSDTLRSVMSGGSGRRPEPDSPAGSETRAQILNDIKKQANASQDQTQYISVDGVPLYIYSEGPNARVAAKYGQLGWVGGPQAHSPGHFQPFRDCHLKELLRILPEHGPTGGEKRGAVVRLSADAGVEDMLRGPQRDARPKTTERKFTPGQATELKPFLRPSTVAALHYFGAALVGIGLAGDWSLGVGIMAGGFVSELYKSAAMKKLFKESGQNLGPLLMSPAATGIGIGCATYGVLSLALGPEAILIPEHAKSAPLFVGLNVFFTMWIFGLGKSGRQ